jgi:predicted alpha/beta-fold hydrolase
LNTYTPPKLLFSSHLETIYPSLFRKVRTQPYTRERISTPDDDFLDLDWMKQKAAKNQERKLVIISHGLEGNTSRAYVRGMARAFYERGADVLAWNYRGCSGEMNRQLRFYHSGATDDLDCVVSHALLQGDYSDIFLIGFSLGGNITLKYLGEPARSLPPAISKAVVFSVPMDLYAGCLKISEPGNWIYSKRFLKRLKNKVKEKSRIKKEIDATGIDAIQDLLGFDNRYTAPLHGFTDALEYYTACSANRFVSDIRLPTLIVNAQNDPFLSPECSPVSMLMHHPFVRLETPHRGGHVGFALFDANGLYWSELRALAFIQP